MLNIFISQYLSLKVQTSEKWVLKSYLPASDSSFSHHTMWKELLKQINKTNISNFLSIWHSISPTPLRKAFRNVILRLPSWITSYLTSEDLQKPVRLNCSFLCGNYHLLSSCHTGWGTYISVLGNLSSSWTVLKLILYVYILFYLSGR